MSTPERTDTVSAREFGRERMVMIARRIRQRRNALHLTQDELRDRLAVHGLGLSKGAISQIENAGIGPEKLPEFAAALGCTPTYLLGYTDNPKSWKADVSLELLPSRVSRDGKVPGLYAVQGRAGPSSIAQHVQPPLAAAVSSSQGSKHHRV